MPSSTHQPPRPARRRTATTGSAARDRDLLQFPVCEEADPLAVGLEKGCKGPLRAGHWTRVELGETAPVQLPSALARSGAADEYQRLAVRRNQNT